MVHLLQLRKQHFFFLMPLSCSRTIQDSPLHWVTKRTPHSGSGGVISLSLRGDIDINYLEFFRTVYLPLLPSYWIIQWLFRLNVDSWILILYFWLQSNIYYSDCFGFGHCELWQVVSLWRGPIVLFLNTFPPSCYFQMLQAPAVDSVLQPQNQPYIHRAWVLYHD